MTSSASFAPGAEFVQATLRADRIRPPDTLLSSSTDESLGVGDLSKARYYDREFHFKEVEKVWKKVWQMACWSLDIPKPGDIYVYDLADISVLIVRQLDGSLKAFPNACLHRGRQLCEKSGHAPALRCPYHSFTWRLDGSLKHIPSKWDFPQIDPRNFNLPPVRVEEWNGFAFINLDPQAPSLRQYMGAMPDQWLAWDLTKRFKSVHVVKRMQANWKIVADAFIEGFHADATHPQVAPFAANEQSQYDIWPGEKHFSRTIALLGSPSSGARLRMSEQDVVDYFIKGYLPQVPLGCAEALVPEGGTAREVISRLYAKTVGDLLQVDLSGLDTASVLDAVYYFVFPNFEPQTSLGFPQYLRFRPYGNDPDQSILDIIILAPFEGERPPSAPVIYQEPEDKVADVLGPLGVIFDQDAAQMAAMQRGVKATFKDGFPLAKYQESRIRHYHRTLMEYIEK